MPVELRLAAAGAAGALLALAATPIAIAVARRTGFYDVPERYKAHDGPTPYLGGGAVMAAFAATGLAFGGAAGQYWPVLAGALLLWVVGTVDDKRFVPPSWRVLAELGAGALLWAMGLGWSVFDLDVLNLALTALWVVAVVNSVNLLDNIDGTAAGTTMVIAAGGGALALVAQAWVLAALAGALAGACAGFLRYNLAGPARIFLGDGGSLSIGFVAAAVVMIAAGAHGGGWPDAVVAVLIVGVPAVDTALVVVSRLRRRVSIMTGGRDHLTHRLGRWLGSARAVTLLLAVAQSLLVAIAIFAVERGTDTIVPLALAVLALAVAVVVILELGPWERRRPESPA